MDKKPSDLTSISCGNGHSANCFPTENTETDALALLNPSYNQRRQRCPTGLAHLSILAQTEVENVVPFTTCRL